MSELSHLTGVTFDIVMALILVLIIFIAQAICYKYDWKPSMEQLEIDRKGSYTIIVYIFICLIGNAISLFIQLSLRYVWQTCSICHAIYIINKILFVITRGVNQLFFTQRAKFSQDIQPILSDKYFDIILPFVIVLLQSMCLLEIIYFDIIYSIYQYGVLQCIDETYICFAPSIGPLYRFTLLYICSASISMFITIIIVFLFLERIYRISSISHEVLSDTNITRQEYKNMYTFNAILVIINVSLTQFMVTLWPLYPTLFWFMPPIDSLLNSLTMYLIPFRNRQWNKKVYYCVCEAICCKCFLRQMTQIPTSSNSMGSNSGSSVPIPMEFVRGDSSSIQSPATTTTQNKHRTTSVCSDIDVSYKTGDKQSKRQSSAKKQWTANKGLSKFNQLPKARLYSDNMTLVDTMDTKHIISGTAVSSNFNPGDDQEDYTFPKLTRFMTVEEFEEFEEERNYL